MLRKLACGAGHTSYCCGTDYSMIRGMALCRLWRGTDYGMVLDTALCEIW